MTTPAPRTTSPDAAPLDGRPLGDVALSLSGGGYRAAGFHLGVLRFLNRVGLLDDVAALSTVSGGSITGAAWIVSQAEGEPFEVFYRRYVAFLKRTNVVRGAVDDLTSHREHGELQYPSLIRSAAEVYASRDLFGDRRLGLVLESEHLKVREVIFNATEFHTGVGFRFLRSENRYARIGNGNFRVPREVAAHVRIADAVAASSCFPSVFEPSRFPDDFVWTEAFTLEDARAALGERFEPALPLMDGGIWDNQGVESILLAYRRVKDGRATLLISDTNQRQETLYDFPAPRKPGRVTVGAVNWLAWLLFLVSLVTIGVVGWNAWRAWETAWTMWDWFLYAFPLALSASVAAGIAWLRLRITQEFRRIQRDVKVDAWPSLRKLTVLELFGLLELRATSLVALTSSVFMKRVRGLIYSNVYQDPAYEGRRITNLVYAMDVERPKLFGAHPWLRPSAALRNVAVTAERMPTTLWFNDPAELKTLIAAGEASVCFNVLRFIVEERAGEYDDPATPLGDLFLRLRNEWEAFNRYGAARPADAAPELQAAGAERAPLAVPNAP